MSRHTCRYCGNRIKKLLIGWAHVGWNDGLHVPRPKRA